MSGLLHVRAHSTAASAQIAKLGPLLVYPQLDIEVIAQHMYELMLRNIASDGYIFADPGQAGTYSRPGCVIAAPSYPANTAGIDQDYVYNWTRDAAITAMEVAVARPPVRPGGGVQPLIDYVNFAQTCQNNARPTLAHACFRIDGTWRDWSDQNDGPALQTRAILAMWDQLDGPTQGLARAVIARNIEFLLGVYQNQTTNLWEEHQGYSFFARAVQLKCFQKILLGLNGIAVPAGVQEAIQWLQNALAQHWNGTTYVSLIPAPQGYDTNIDIVCAAVYGAIPYTDTKLLASAARLRWQWADPASPDAYPINAADKAQGVGPLMGRYPGDVYDGDVQESISGDHPWALCTANFAQLYYGLAKAIAASNTVPWDANSQTFFMQIGVTEATPPADAVTALNSAGDAMMQAIIYHSDNLELSEQFDGVSGYEKSVKNLTWSYAAFLSAVREKTGQTVKG